MTADLAQADLIRLRRWQDHGHFWLWLWLMYCLRFGPLAKGHALTSNLLEWQLSRALAKVANASKLI